LPRFRVGGPVEVARNAGGQVEYAVEADNGTIYGVRVEEIELVMPRRDDLDTGGGAQGDESPSENAGTTGDEYLQALTPLPRGPAMYLTLPALERSFDPLRTRC